MNPTNSLQHPKMASSVMAQLSGHISQLTAGSPLAEIPAHIKGMHGELGTLHSAVEQFINRLSPILISEAPQGVNGGTAPKMQCSCTMADELDTDRHLIRSITDMVHSATNRLAL